MIELNWEELYAKHEREEAKEFDEFAEFAFGVYHTVDREKLVGNIPIELSSLMYNLLGVNDNSPSD